VLSGAAVSAPLATNSVAQDSTFTNALEAAARPDVASQALLATPAALAAAAQALHALTNNNATITAQLAVPVPSAPPQPEEFQITATGATAQFGPHVANLPVNVTDGIQLLVPSRTGLLELRSRVAGLFYYSPRTGDSIALATLQDSVGEYSPPNRIIYTNAMAGSDIEITYTYTRNSFEQDLVLRRQLPDPEALGFDSSSVMLAVISELLEPPPVIRVPEVIDLRPMNQALGVEGLDALPCESLFFGSMRILGVGQAFLLGDTGTTVPTGTSFEQINGKFYLIESTPYSLIRAQINSLPAGTLHASLGQKGNLRTLLAQWPTFKTQNRRGSDRILLAKSDTDTRPGVVLDYQIVTSHLLNIDCGGANPEKTGFAAVGQSTNDFWTTCSASSTPVSLPNLKWSDSTNSAVGLVVSNAPGGWGSGSTDRMYNSYLYAYTGNLTLTITNLPTNVYSFYIYGHAGAEAANSAFQLYRAGTQIAYKGTSLWGQG